MFGVEWLCGGFLLDLRQCCGVLKVYGSISGGWRKNRSEMEEEEEGFEHSSLAHPFLFRSIFTRFNPRKTADRNELAIDCLFNKYIRL